MSERVLEVAAWAKVNLTLDVLRKRDDGYHDLCMVMQSVSLRDTVRVTVETGAPLSVETNLPFLPGDENNLAAVAARQFCAATGFDPGGLALDITKSIPVCAGLGGGSSDAAATLRALNTLAGTGLSGEQLAAIGAQVGSDVPYCVRGGTMLAEGRGERLSLLPALPPCTIVLCKPNLRVSTPQLFAALDLRRVVHRPDTAGVLAALEAGDLRGVAQRMYNIFEDVTTGRVAGEVGRIKATLLELGALGAVMSGTGPTVLGVFDQAPAAEAARDALAARYTDVFLTQCIPGES